MAKTKTKTQTMSDEAVTLLVWPQAVVLRCDHAGADIPEGHEPDVHHESTPDGPHLVRHRYTTRCKRFGATETVTLAQVDDPARVCPSCGFYRTIAEAA